MTDSAIIKSIRNSINSALGSLAPTPGLFLQLGRLYKKHCLDKNGEVASHPFGDLWLNNSELDTHERLSNEAAYDDGPWTDEERDRLRWEACQMLDSYGKDA